MDFSLFGEVCPLWISISNLPIHPGTAIQQNIVRESVFREFNVLGLSSVVKASTSTLEKTQALALLQLHPCNDEYVSR